ncbi:SGNH/GDSL hydrolase family protein [Phenylobacterium sp. LjRoot219]|uniref:SGNH/GDSL hydrolase family protein n=1 Tax=Phenylobacterium sp. LjRoot219 TaxID=3342283 RepID=UPI003ECF0A43
MPNVCRRLLAGLALSAGVLAAPAVAAPLPAGAKYVAMGSSFAAGPGVTTSADTPANRCSRSIDNYAHQLARKRGLALTDVSCSGATTAHLLGPWDELPPQLDAVDADTRLVTITIGGNDLGYIGGLMAASCAGLAAEAGRPASKCPVIAPPTDKSFQETEARLRAIAAEVRRRAPAARLVFVQYPVVLPAQGTCAATPITDAQADAGRRIAAQLAAITARAAKDAGADLLAADQLSGGHDACAQNAWMNGFPRPGAPVAGVFYHPNLAGMTAVAAALDRLLE